MKGGFGPQKEGPIRPIPSQEGLGYFLAFSQSSSSRKIAGEKGLSQGFIHRNVSGKFTYKFQSLPRFSHFFENLPSTSILCPEIMQENPDSDQSISGGIACSNVYIRL